MWYTTGITTENLQWHSEYFSLIGDINALDTNLLTGKFCDDDLNFSYVT